MIPKVAKTLPKVAKSYQKLLPEVVKLGSTWLRLVHQNIKTGQSLMSTRCWREICFTKLFFSRAYPDTSLQGAYINHILLLPVAGFFLTTGAAFWFVCSNVRSQATQFNSADLWHLRHGLQFWQLRTWIQDNLCYPKEWQWTAVAILVYIVDFHSACS